MDTLHSLEIAVTLFLQGLGGWLTTPMKLFSFFGQEEFYLLLMPILYWCIDSAIGLRIGLMLLLAQFTNTFFKLLLHQPRPYWFDARVKALSTETSFGMPSGHSQSAAGIWGLLAVLVKKRWAVISSLLLIFMIGFSRIYLGVHFLTDVLSGWLLGGLLLFAFVRLEKKLTPWITRLTMTAQMGMAAVSSIGIILLSLVGLAVAPGWSMPADWSQLAAAAAPAVTPDPLSVNGIFTIAGTWFGLLVGLAWMWHTRGKFDASGTGLQRLLRYLIGGAGVLFLWYGLGAVFPRTLDVLGYLLRYLRYFLIGIWISALAPLLFQRLRIARFLPVNTSACKTPETSYNSTRAN